MDRRSAPEQQALVEESTETVFVMQFMDPQTSDLSRARRCCQVYPQPDGRLIPVCVRNYVEGSP